MTTICDECTDRIRLAEQDKAIEKVLDLAQAAELTRTPQEFQLGWKLAIREVVKLLKETK
jgi:hypothetical protein